MEELGLTMSSAEFGEWIAFEREYGIPDPYFTTGQVCTSLASAFGGKADPAEYVRFFRRPKQTPAEMRAAFKRITGRV